MKIDLSTIIHDLNGKPVVLVDSEEPLTVKETLEKSLIGGDPQNQDVSVKYKRYQLLIRIKETEKIIDLSSEEITDLKKLIAQVWHITTFGRVVDILEGKEKEKK